MFQRIPDEMLKVLFISSAGRANSI